MNVGFVLAGAALTVRQPWASLIVAGIKRVENRTWRPPRTMPTWMLCETCGARDRLPYRPTWSDCRPAGADHGWRKADGPFPFRLWVHAGKADTDNDRSIPHFAWDALSDVIGGDAPVRGALVGSVLVTGCHDSEACWVLRGSEHGDLVGPAPDGWHCSPFALPDAYHWTLSDPRPLPKPIPMKGRQGLWTLPDGVAVPA